MTGALGTGSERLAGRIAIDEIEWAKLAIWSDIENDPGVVALVDGMKAIANTSTEARIRDLAVAALRTWESG